MIKLKTIQRSNPADANAARMYYVSAGNGGEVTLEDLTTAISDRCTVTEPDVLAVLSALQREMTVNLMGGKIVRFGTFGSFQLGLSSTGVEKQEDASQQQVRRLRVKFRPGMRIRDQLKLAKFTLSND